MTIKRFLLAAAVLLGLSSLRAEACTNIIITKGASACSSRSLYTHAFILTHKVTHIRANGIPIHVSAI